MAKKKRNEVLLVGDELDVHARLGGELRAKEYEVTCAVEGEEGLARAMRSRFDVVVSEIEARGLSGLELLRRLRSVKPGLPVILLSAVDSAEINIEASKLGAFDFVTKPFDISELVGLVGSALSRNRAHVPSLGPAPAGFGRNGLSGSSAMMRHLYKRIGIAADSEETVLITGASGTGKELIANAIHQHSGRKRHFVPVNCGAIPDSLFESQMFGHEKGAFTGADGRQAGLFELAHQGTLFLDEIGDLNQASQVKLLRVLQEPRIRHLGGSREIELDLRVVAATHHNLLKRIEEGKFREDLFFRLNTFIIYTPALSAHSEDIPDLVNHFLRQIHKKYRWGHLSIEPEAVEFLTKRNWPGNVRELRSAVCRAASEARGDCIRLNHVREACELNQQPPTVTVRKYRQTLTDLIERAKSGQITDLRARALAETDYSVCTRIIDAAKGNKAKAARWLGVTRTTLRQRLKKFQTLFQREENEDAER